MDLRIGVWGFRVKGEGFRVSGLKFGVQDRLRELMI